MSKKKLSCVVVILICTTVVLFFVSCNTSNETFCTSNEGEGYCVNNDEDIVAPEGLSLTVVPGTLSHYGAILRLTNNTGNRYLRYPLFDLPRLYTTDENENWWIRVPFIIGERTVISIVDTIPARSYVLTEVNFEFLFGKLPCGEYKITQTVYRDNLGAPRHQVHVSTIFTLHDDNHVRAWHSCF